MSDDSLYKEDDASKLASELFSGKLAVGDALAKLRTRLLDLSMRNRLLNYKHPKGRSFQFVDSPDLNLLFERLEEGKSVPLLYVPDPPMRRYEGGKKPEARIYAREVDIGTSVDIEPSTETTAYRRLSGLQVLQYPADLERGVRKISSEARTVIEETGTNMLYLMFGFMEYFDSEDSEKPVLAPLLSMPVNLVRGKLDEESRTYLYELSHSGEDIAENFTLREKLRQQFRLELPELGEEDTPEDYFTKIQAAVSKRLNWKVRRRLSLGFLSFGKLAIWADLDPAKSQGLLSSELLRNIFEGGRVDVSGAFHSEDYDIDGHDDAELPLIYDADSSQHSALIDVKSGKSLVINGPPGTGKSQTITNIIASAIASGKKVLFVSEKLAALEVVKQRLEKAKLGDFCLELHSHKTQKKLLLESVEQRMSRRYHKPAGYEAQVSVLREKRNTLNAYSTLLGSSTGNGLDLSVHSVFWITERNRQSIENELDALAGISILGAEGWNASQLERCRTVLSDAASALDELRCPPHESPWLGFRPVLLIKGDEPPILRTVEQALVHAREAESATRELGLIFGGAAWTIGQLNDAQHAVEILASAPSNLEGELLESMFVDGAASAERVNGELQRLSTLLGNIRELRRHSVERLSFKQPTDFHQLMRAVQEGWHALAEAALSQPPSEVLDSGVRLNELLERLTKLTKGRELNLPEDVDSILRKLVSVAGNPESPQWMLTPAPELIAAGAAASRTAGDVHASLEQVASVLRASGVPFSGRTEELQSLLDGRGMPELLPDAVLDDSLLEELRRLNAGGWGDWTAEQFAATARESAEVVAEASQAAEELKKFFSRLGVPVEVSKSWLDSIEVLLSVMESAPKELLTLRCAGLERTDFADIAIRAEDAYKNIAYKASKVDSAFHLDTLPDEESLRVYVQTFRRGDSFFNVFRSDWRRAKNAFKGTTKQKKNATAEVMSEQFSAVLSWKTSQREFCANEQFKSSMGPLFNGIDTDFTKARRLHEWTRTGAASLLATEVGQHVNLVSIPEQHILLIAGTGAKVKGWISKLHRLSQFVHSLPGIDPALGRVRRIDELFTPLDQYGKNLLTGAALVRSVVRPTGSVKRAQELVELRRRIGEHSNLLRALIQAPNQLARDGAALGMSSSPLSYQNLRESVTQLQAKADAARALGECVTRACGGNESPQSTLSTLQLLADFDTGASTVLSSKEVPVLGSLQVWIDTRRRQLAAVSCLVEPLVPISKPGVSIKDAVEAIQSGIEATRIEVALSRDQSLVRLLGDYLCGEATDESQLNVCQAWGSDVCAIAEHLPVGAADELLKADSKRTASTVARLISTAGSAIKSYHQALSNIEKWGEFDWVKWGGAPTPADAVKRLERALVAGEALVPWSKYLAACNEAEPLGVDELIQQVANGSLKSSSLVQAFDYVFFKTLSRGVLSKHRELAKFTGSGHERLRTEFAKLDKELIALNGEMYAYKVDSSKRLLKGVSSGRVGDLTEMALLTKETKKQKRHIPIRQLLRRAGRSLQELKPCFMMGPLSVAQYLEQGHLQFDLVVMDEASQLRPEDALGALARGKQLVVVGDPKQLPPTNFFGRLMEDENDDPDAEPAVVDGVESILGICEHLYRPVRTLRWHYRSQHESLIAFSNSQFYDGRLVVFPSPYKRNKRLGVNYRYVREGVYQDRRNIPEAQRVVDAVYEHMLLCPDESLGVVTLNQTQRELIEDLLDKKLRSFPGASDYLDRHEQAGWGFFVKNLENVQGDERDVIFVSTTFGKPPDGSAVRQTFGPINRPDGWRRLNVLFTRARRRIDLFTSMQPTDVVVDEKVSLGRKALREYLEYAQSGHLPSVRGITSGREADSDFEIAVSDALRNRGYETESQVGVAGYFIDLGVRHPERRGEFLAGVECDGVTYHSSLSARDRDRIRQEVLESLGWRGRIIRVWSTDWFADPIGQTDRLVTFLEQRLENDLAQPAPYSDEDLAEHSNGEDQLLAGMGPAPDVALDNHQADTSGSPVDRFVEVGDRVTYEVLSDPIERHTVQIIDSASNLRLGLLNESTPVAQALIGLCVGDDAELRIDHLPARTLRILSIEKQSVDEGV